MFLTWIVVMVGGAFGCLGRFLVSEGVYATLGRNFPYGTLTANILGSFMMGVLAEIIINRLELGPLWRIGVLVGFLGGFTTFSSFSIDTVQLIQQGFLIKAFVYVVASVLICVVATFLGMYLAESIA